MILPLPNMILPNFTAPQHGFTGFYRSAAWFYRSPTWAEFTPALKTCGIAPGDANNAIAHVFATAECSGQSGKPDKISKFEVPPISQIFPSSRAPLQNPASLRNEKPFCQTPSSLWRRCEQRSKTLLGVPLRIFVGRVLSLQLLRQPLKPIPDACWIRMLPSEAKTLPTLQVFKSDFSGNQFFRWWLCRGAYFSRNFHCFVWECMHLVNYSKIK